MPVNGRKRSANEVDDASEGEGLAAGRPARQARRKESSSSSASASASPIAAPAAGIPIDVLPIVASFTGTGRDLRNLCIAVGPKHAKGIRNAYLRDNETYIVQSLRMLPVLIPDLAGHVKVFRDNAHRFDKCRDNVMTWMDVNSKSWKGRCTPCKMNMYADKPLVLETDLVFNNPAVVVELGLLEVLRFLVEEKDIDVNTANWNGFTSNSEGVGNFSLGRLIFLRGNIGMLHYFLSLEKTHIPSFHQVLLDWHYLLPRECFEIIVRHPRFDPNFAFGLFFTQLRGIVNWMGEDKVKETRIGFRAKVIIAFLDAGADPRTLVQGFGGDLAPIDIVRRMLVACPGSFHLERLGEKMQEVITLLGPG